MEEIIKNGIKYANPHGINSVFYPSMFIRTRDMWKTEMDRLRVRSDVMFDECYPDAHDGGSVGLCGQIIISVSDGYVYVYMIDARGNMDSIMYTHAVIAGQYTYVPPYGGYAEAH